MRAPAILAQCWPGLLPHDKAGHGGVSIVSERDLTLPTPAVEIVPSKNAHPYSYTGENVDLQGFYIFKGRISVSDMIGMPNQDVVSSKQDCTPKSGECMGDLVHVLKLEVCDGRLSFRGKQVLELGCGYGLAGILACLKGASKVHFQDINAETVRCMTIPNVLANIEQARDRQSRQSESPLTPTRLQMTSDIHFYAGDWEELHTVLTVVQPVPPELAQGPPDLSFSEDDFMDGCSSQDGSVIGLESHRRRSQKLSGSRAWERASETDPGDGGYDIILMTEIPHSVSSLKKLYALITKCLRPPYGVLYLSVKRHFVGSNNGARQLRTMVDEEGLFGVHVVVELADKEIWKFFFK